MDLSRHSEADLRGAVLLQVVLLSLRHVFDEDLPARLPGILSVLREVAGTETGMRAIEAFPEDGEGIMTTLHGQWIEKGIEKGELSRSRKVVIEALRVRFADAPAPVIDEVQGIEDQAVLEELHRKAITVASLDDFRRELERLRP